MKNLINFILFGLMTSCSSMPGSINSSVTPYDGRSEVKLEPGFASKSSPFGNSIKIGAIKNSEMPRGEAELIVRIDMIKNFSFKSPNFYLKINGKEHALSPVEADTDCTTTETFEIAHCKEHYRVNIQLIKDLVTAKDVRFKLDLDKEVPIQGFFDSQGPTGAKAGLIVFLRKLKIRNLID